jgi:hypothetical protein
LRAAQNGSSNWRGNWPSRPKAIASPD